jgi:hypothetical protein
MYQINPLATEPIAIGLQIPKGNISTLMTGVVPGSFTGEPPGVTAASANFTAEKGG